MDLSFHPPVIAHSTNDFAEENNLQWRPVLSGSSLHKEITCVMFVHGKQTTFMRKLTYAISYRPCWDKLAEEYCLVNVVQILLRQNCTRKLLVNVGPEHSDTISQENNLYNVVLICLCQHCTQKVPLQCWSKAQEQLFTAKQYPILSWSMRANHCARNLLVQCYPMVTKQLFLPK